MKTQLLLSQVLVIGVLSRLSTAAVNPWDRYIQSPPSRSVPPVAIYTTTGNVVSVSKDARNAALDTYRLSGPNSSVTFDFGKRIAGYPTINFGRANCTLCSTLGLPAFSCDSSCQGLGVAYSELSDFVGLGSDHQTIYGHDDGTIFVPIRSNQNYTVPTKYSRGSYRYLTLSLSPHAQSKLSVEIQLPFVYFDAAPNLPETALRTYTGYFYSSDDLLNQIWYAGAYTNQLCTIAANSSVQHLAVVTGGWSNDANADGLTGSDFYLADGAKRDRNPWAGDLDVSLKSAIVSVNYDNLLSVKNTLRECIVLQDSIGGFFPYAGSPLGNLFAVLGESYVSDTYNLWTITNFADYVLASGDTVFGNKYWSQITKGIRATYQYVDSADGLYSGTKTSDWARIGQGGKNIALNSLYYHTLLNVARLAIYLSDANAAAASDYQLRASKVRASVNSQLWDASAGLYWDNTTAAGHSIHPTDGNTAAINFGLTNSTAQSLAIAEGLAMRLTKFGAVLPELPGGIAPYAASQEIRAQFIASPDDASRALKLIRTQWGYMITKFGNSTLIEGYNSNGTILYPFYPNDASFVSLAHAWSTGPTYTLMARVVGIRANPFDVGIEEGDWAFQPSVRNSNLTSVQGGFTLRMGDFKASWSVSGTQFSATLTTPLGTNGTVYAPGLTDTGNQTVKVDGKVQKNARFFGNFYKLSSISGGTHTIEVK